MRALDSSVETSSNRGGREEDFFSVESIGVICHLVSWSAASPVPRMPTPSRYHLTCCRDFNAPRVAITDQRRVLH